ncbi:MAG: thioredoxin domain-containing protein [Flammeovirgaceae bacterium]|nr:thioredoxin domain-containing protein [Flammeovirgaceae bacterium]MDW8288058.1 thioredoxin domain-containing protein [Flammeovirgaceae bacterium]
MLPTIKTLDDFEKRILKTPHPKLLLLTTSWSDKGKVLTQVMENIHPTYEKYIEFFKIETDKLPEVTEKYKVSSLPALMLVYEGQIEDFTIKFTSKEMVIGILESFFTRKGKNPLVKKFI